LKDQTIHYRRKKSGSDAMPRFGKGAAAVLARLPKSGPLFPYLITCDCKDRTSTRTTSADVPEKEKKKKS
jgi:hypothetical protein